MWIMCKTRLLLPFLPGGNKYSVYAEYSLINGYSAVKRRFFDALCKSCRRSKLHTACFALAGKSALIPLLLLSKSQPLTLGCYFVFRGVPPLFFCKLHIACFAALRQKCALFAAPPLKITTALPGCNFAKEMGVFPRAVSAEKACRTRDKNTAWRRKTVSRGRTYRDCPRSFLRSRISRP